MVVRLHTQRNDSLSVQTVLLCLSDVCGSDWRQDLLNDAGLVEGEGGAFHLVRDICETTIIQLMMLNQLLHGLSHPHARL